MDTEYVLYPRLALFPCPLDDGALKMWQETVWAGDNLDTLYECKTCSSVISLYDVSGYRASTAELP